MDDRDAAPKKPSRTRTGCLNCRRRKRKCDERRPSCGACCKTSQLCEWGLKLSFREENAHRLDSGHPSMRMAATRRPREYEILDVTSEVIRDYRVASSAGLDRLDGAEQTRRMDPERTSSAAWPMISPLPQGNNLSQGQNDSFAESLELPFGGVRSPLATSADASPRARLQTENAVASLLCLRQGGQTRETPSSRCEFGEEGAFNSQTSFI